MCTKIILINEKSRAHLTMNNNDRRRILGPSDAKIPAVGEPVANDTQVQLNDQFYCKTNYISNANGSSYVESNGNIITVSVFGPRPIKASFIDQASVSVEVKFLPHLISEESQTIQHLVKKQSQNPNGRPGLTLIEHQISQFIETCLVHSILLNKYPKLTIDLHISVLEFNGDVMDLVKWIVCGCSLALVDSGIEIKDIITAGYIKNSEDMVIDGEDQVDVNCLVSFMSLKNEIVGIWVNGDLKDLDATIEKCSDMAKKIRSNVNSYLLENFS